MTEEIDIRKLTDDAFMAIDALFTDEDDNDFSLEEKKQPDDFDLIQECMLAIEWECSDRNIKKFIDFLNKISPKYSGKHNQDILKMLSSIVRYLEKSKADALPETHQVLELIVKTFKNINQDGMNEALIKQDKNNAYNRVMELKEKIKNAKAKGATSYMPEERPQISESEYNEENISTLKSEPVQTQQISAAIPMPQGDAIEKSPIIISIITRLGLCESKLQAINAQSITLRQQIDNLIALNDAINKKVSELDLKFNDKIDEFTRKINSITISDNSIQRTSKMDQIIEDTSPFNSLQTDEEISFDGIDFEEMYSNTDIDYQSSSFDTNQTKAETDNIAIDEIEIDKIDLGEIGFEELDIDDAAKSEQQPMGGIDFNRVSSDALISEKENLINVSDNLADDTAEDITSDEIEYEDLKQGDIQYDDIDANQYDTEKNNLESDGEEKVDYSQLPIEELNEDIEKDDNKNEEQKEPITEYVRCFKMENQVIALPDDKIYNIYKIPNRLIKNINKMPVITLGEFSSFFQNLLKNMKGTLKSISVGELKKMNVDIHLLTTNDIQYKMAVLCSFEDKVSIIPVTDIYDNKTYPIVEIKDEHNDFSDYNVSITDTGTIPYVPFNKK